jgi:phosphate starvation-inducible protein PhoH
VPEIGFVTFDERDVVRHPIVQQIVAAYESEERGRQDEAASPGR